MTLDLEAISARAAAATPGPWITAEIGVGRDVYHDVLVVNPDENDVLLVARIEIEGDDGATADFIASARADVPALVSEVRRLRGALEAMVRHEQAENAREDLDESMECQRARAALAPPTEGT